MSSAEPSHANPVKKRIDVAFLPKLIDPASLSGRTVIVTDVLRATTTIIHALHNGAEQVLPQPSIEAAREAHANTENSVMGGERGGRIVKGFHHGNSPIEYTAEAIAGKTLILATTNGTVAMEQCREADRVLIGAMVNLSQLASQIMPEEKVTVVCSGTDGFVTGEDVIFAGAIVERIIETETAKADPNDPLLISDMAGIALNNWKLVKQSVEQGTDLADVFRSANGGVNLVKIGHDADVVFASKIDTVPVVPELNIEAWSIKS